MNACGIETQGDLAFVPGSITVKDSREAMRRMHEYGHHLSMVCGNGVEQMRDLGVLTDFEVERV